MQKAAILGLAALASPALAAGVKYSLVVDGQVAPDQAIVVNGKTYVPLSALKLLGVNTSLKGSTLTLGAKTAPGGANQVAALEGCVGETLFNGIWRVKVTSLRAIGIPDAGSPDIPGWAVGLEMRNGARQTTSMMSTGFGASSGGSDPALILADGSALKLDGGDFLRPWSQDVLQGGATTFTLRFAYPRGTTGAQAKAQPPAKFILQINPKIPDYVGVKYSVSDPSLRVRLDCRK